MSDPRAPRQSAIATGLLLFAIYLATGAPSLTFWDASEFATAIATFGVPHPPGTPLYVAMGTALWHLVPGLSPAQAGTMLSALSTAGACATAAWLITRISGVRRTGVIAGVAAGTMGTVWMNATETEVYAVSLLCVAAQLAVAWRAHAADDDRARVMLMFLAALSIPVHLSALVATPAALLLANTDGQGRVRWSALVASLALVGATIALSMAYVWMALALIALVAVSALAQAGLRPSPAWLARAAAVTLLGWSAVMIMLVRARHLPFLNQGDPGTVATLLDVMSRAQYDVAGLWPRRAPIWLQLGNIIQYADWQVALSLWNDVTPSLLRTPFSVLAGGLGVVGAVAHWRAHPVTARALTVLMLLATVGVCLQLNLRAGPSFGIGVLPATAVHEARERDYFYALAFWGWGLWIGIGAMALTTRSRAPNWLAAAIPALLIGGNWSAVTRAVWPDRLLTTAIAGELLEYVPRNGLLLTAGDNDTYPLWYRQAVDGHRADVQVVVMSLLPANWYLRESARRVGPFATDSGGQSDPLSRAAWLARQKLDVRGGVAISILVDATTRTELGRLAGITCWRRAGLVDIGSAAREYCPPRLDAERSFASARRLQPYLSDAPRQSPDGMVEAFMNVARCPGAVASFAMGGGAPADSATRTLLDITCNLR